MKLLDLWYLLTDQNQSYHPYHSMSQVIVQLGNKLQRFHMCDTFCSCVFAVILMVLT